MKRSISLYRLLSILLVVCLAVSLCSLAVLAEEAAEPEAAPAATEEAPPEAAPAAEEPAAPQEAPADPTPDAVDGDVPAPAAEEPVTEAPDTETQPEETAETVEPTEPAEPAAETAETVIPEEEPAEPDVDGDGEEADPYNYTVTSGGIQNSLGESVGKSLKIKNAGTYTLTGVDLEDYAYGRVQVQGEGVTLVLNNVWLTYTNGATINCKYDTIIAVQGANFLTRVIDNEADPTEDGGKVIKGESDTIGQSVSITFTGDGTLNIDAPKKGIGTDVYFGDEINEDITSVTLDATINFGEPGAESGPTINITGPDETVEANVVNFNAGGGTFISTGDDGINAATDGDDQDEDDVDGDGNVREYMYPNLIRNLDFTQLSINVNGGKWVVISNNDGLDSNGNISVTGGEMQVFSSTQADNNAVDYGAENGGTFTVTGGKLLAVGMNGMQRQETPTSNFVIFLDQNVQAGDPIVITDADGNVLYTATGVKSANCILYCDASLVEGDTYTVTVGNTSSTAVAGEGNNRGSGEPSREPSGEPSGELGSTSTAAEGSAVPKTSDASGAGLWAVVLILCAGTAAALLPRNRSGRTF